MALGVGRLGASRTAIIVGVKSTVPDSLIRAAEDLFAERGSDAVSLREIITASGVSNASAIQYHFGDRRGLIRAILDKHEPAVDQHRQQLLDAYVDAGQDDMRELASALVVPLAKQLENSDGGLGYLQLLSDLYNRPNPTFDPAKFDEGAHSIHRWRALVMPLLTPEAVRLHRRFDADHPEIFASEDKGITPIEYVLVGLASCLTAGVAAVAQNRGIQLRSVESKLEGKMDIRGILGIDSDVRNGYDDIKVTFKIDADASKKDIEALVAQSQKRSAVYDVIANPVNVTVEVV